MSARRHITWFALAHVGAVAALYGVALAAADGQTEGLLPEAWQVASAPQSTTPPAAPAPRASPLARTHRSGDDELPNWTRRVEVSAPWDRR